MRSALLAVTALCTVTASVRPVFTAASQTEAPGLDLFFQASASDPAVGDRALAALVPVWRNGYAAMLIDMARFLKSGPGTPRARLIAFLEARTNERFGDDLGAWREWIWRRPYEPHPRYMEFKAAVYRGAVEPRTGDFLRGQAAIRLDEIDWGGVKVNGIPPLVSPRVIPARDATYLDDSHLVYGVAVGGEARAYPRRILAWHEMARDTLGGVKLTVVYCTLCGTVIPYRSVVGGVERTFGTSGLLYRSNKLMFDEESGSLWSTLEGKPVVGSLVGSGLTLEMEPVVTTTWGEWRRRHPHTTVLSLATGFDRDYGDGVAYRDYFATDRLMFRVPRLDSRLKTKDEVLGLLLPAVGGGRQAVAFFVGFLQANRVFHGTYEGRSLVVLTTPGGANRVYETGGVRVVKWQDAETVVDSTGRLWRVTEGGLVGHGGEPANLPRVPAARAFWFGWYAQFPETVLIK